MFKMVTKQELEEEFKTEIEKSRKELKFLEERHKKFEKEHKKDEIREKKHQEIRQKRDDLLNKKWERNWGNRENWCRGLIPKQFLFNEEDTQLIKEALTEVASEKEKEIVQTKEYQNLKKEGGNFVWDCFSKEHKELDKKIEDLKEGIEHYSSSINRIQSRGGLIKEGKDRKNRESWEEKNRIEEEKLKKYKERILQSK